MPRMPVINPRAVPIKGGRGVRRVAERIRGSGGERGSILRPATVRVLAAVLPPSSS